MKIVPVVNAPDIETAERHIRIAEKFLPEDGWIHLDVTDGVFSKHPTWGTPEEFSRISTRLKTEVHLMIEHPERYIEEWCAAGAKRVIVHFQTIRDSHALIRAVSRHSVDIMLSVDASVSVQEALPYARIFSFLQVLAVEPGPAGQKFDTDTLSKIEFLRREFPNATIEVDGGINLDTARMVKKAGADMATSATYIFGDPDPESAYRRLSEI